MEDRETERKALGVGQMSLLSPGLTASGRAGPHEITSKIEVNKIR